MCLDAAPTASALRKPSLYFPLGMGVKQGAGQTFVEVEAGVCHPSDLDNGGSAQGPGADGHEYGEDGEAADDQCEMSGRGDQQVDQDDGNGGGPAGEGEQSPVEGGVARKPPAQSGQNAVESGGYGLALFTCGVTASCGRGATLHGKRCLCPVCSGLSRCSLPVSARFLPISDMKRAESRQARRKSPFSAAGVALAGSDPRAATAAGADQTTWSAAGATRPRAKPAGAAPRPALSSPPPGATSPGPPASGLTPAPAGSGRTRSHPEPPPRLHRPTRRCLPTPATSPGDRG